MDKVVHFEIEADNLERAVKFYKDVFGWEIKKYPMQGMEYYVVHTVDVDKKQMPKEVGAINGGMQKKTGQVKGPVIVMKVKSVEKTLVKIKKMGGKVVMPKVNVGGMGLYARVSDPEGNVVGVWEDVKQ